MPGNVFRQGTLLILSGPVNHLHVVMNDPVFSHEHGYDGVLIVNISSLRAGVYHDPTCLLMPGCHRFVTRDSWVVYQHAAVMDASRLDVKIDSGEVTPHDLVRLDIFNQVRAGFDTSKHVTPKIKRFLRQNGI